MVEVPKLEIEASVVERLISFAILVPKEINLQPWAFGVVLDPTRIEEYGKRAKIGSD